MDRFFFSAGAIAAFIAVALGAFGAHSLKSKISAEMLDIFEVGVRYQMYHALGLMPSLGRLPAGPSVGSEFRRLVLHRRHRDFLRQPVSAELHRHALARRHHPHRRPGVPRRLGDPDLVTESMTGDWSLGRSVAFSDPMPIISFAHPGAFNFCLFLALGVAFPHDYRRTERN